MKFINLLVPALFAALPASADVSSQPDPVFLGNVHTLVARCAVREMKRDPRGNSVQLPLQSRCPELAVRGRVAAFELNGEAFRARLVPSPFSDGGDLWHLQITDRQGHTVAFVQNVLAYGDVLLALAGGEGSLNPSF